MFLIGVNGAGKSSILQALAFVRAFIDGRTVEFFDDRQWQVADVRPRIKTRVARGGSRLGMRLSTSKNLNISLLFEEGESSIYWDFTWGYVANTLIEENIWIRSTPSDEPRLYIDYSRPTRQTADVSEQFRLEDLKFSGSILAVIPPERIASGRDLDLIRMLVSWSQGITSLELLSPTAMRKSVRGSPKDIGPRGERLSGFIAGLTAQKKQDLVSRVSKFYPLSTLDTLRKTAGWIEMRMLESFEGIGRINPSHMSDGFMRILALCAIPEFDDDVSVILLDEVEDGIEPHVLPRIIDFVTSVSNCQFIMTSHSPLLVNYFDKEDVCFLTRSQEGRTIIAAAADIKIFDEGADYYGVGEVWVNLNADVIAEAVLAHALDRQSKHPSFRSDIVSVVAYMDGR